MAQEHEGVGPLAGTFVLDVTHVMAGSYCGLLLSMMGAEVVKVERAGGGDDLRRHQTLSGGAFRPHDAVNHGKRSLAVDLRDPRGADVLRRLADRADAFVVYRGIYDSIYDIAPGGIHKGTDLQGDPISPFARSLESLDKEERDNLKFNNHIRDAYVDLYFKKEFQQVRI